MRKRRSELYNSGHHSISLGLYVPDDFASAIPKARDYEALFHTNMCILSFYEAWGRADKGPDAAGIEHVLENGFTPMITWEPWELPEFTPERAPQDQPNYGLSHLLDGSYDEYIRRWAIDLRDLSAPVFFRPMHELNGDWYPWCGQVNGNRPEDYAHAWRHIRAIFREARNDKLIWVWCPYVHSVPDSPDNAMERYFPGDENVDWLALDGYNWGTSREWSRWESFSDIFERAYERLVDLSPDKPLMLAEIGCAEQGGDKGLWIRQAMNDLEQRLTATKALIWFNVDKECDWRIESSAGSLRSFKESWKHRGTE